MRGKKGLIITAHVAPPRRTRTISLDKLGPLSAKTYPGAEWVFEKSRATFQPAYGRRGKVWVHGAFEPATGEATLVLCDKRDSVSHIRLLEKITEDFPSDRWLLVEDNLSIHHRRETKLTLAAWPEIQVLCLPKYACWLNLIEPGWKQLKSLALKGRRFENQAELEAALWYALDYWNAHRYPYRWKKLLQEQLPPWGGFDFSKSS
jgi:transposase